LQQKSLFKLKLKNILFHIQTVKRLKQHIDKVFSKLRLLATLENLKVDGGGGEVT
jgi:hypothetical protein